MQRPRNLSIRTKLILLATASASCAILFMCAGFWINYVETLRASQVVQLTSQARILAFNATGVMTFDDAAAGDELLRSLGSQPQIEVGCLYRNQGGVLAQYTRSGTPVYTPSPNAPAPGHRYTTSGHLEVSLPVIDAGERVGVVLLRANTENQRTQLFYFAKLALAVTVGSLLAAVLLAAGLQRRISAPITCLARATRDITTREDFSQRVEHTGTDEIARLYTAFNKMLQRVQTSKQALQNAHDELEDRVLKRTAQLSDEMTRRELIQKDLERSKEAAEAANRAKSEFLANMSHEIRTPLNGILGFADLLRLGADENNEEIRRDYLSTIHASGQHLLDLINDILDLSKIEAGQLEVEQVDCSIQQVVCDVVSVLRVKAIENEIALNCRWETELPEVAQTDPARLRQLLMNLAGNAIKFTAEGSVDIVLRVEGTQAESTLQVAVVDTGIGIAADKLEHIFDPFVQADNSVTRKFGGTGLGLAISRKIARALGGELSVESTLGQGSTFRFHIPLGDLNGIAMISATDADGIQTSSVDMPTEVPRLEGLSVLLVEDGETNRKLIRLMLDRHGVEVATAENGQVGFEKAISGQYDVVLMDMQMPVMDGYTATTRLREQEITTPIIALTAHAMKGDQEKCLEAGCSGYLTKPIDEQRLLNALASFAPDEWAGKLATSASSCSPTTIDGTTMERVPVAAHSPLTSSLPLDDPDFRQIVEEFIEKLMIKLTEMHRCLAAGQLDELARLAHWLKGSGGTCGFNELTAPAAELCEAARAEDQANAAIALETLHGLAARISRPMVAE